ncbi:cbb3-type cytochrome oxidase assembly protein CcoS [Methylophilus methylotrophus]|uniref:cbb3-type cytochrome oxidase assembly protein CcoS n=1 Tax=Methylophilus methylotrophus TaxID=17 RepID=UPI000364A623|nr:cbb3-type cytochrome oxidase assembly protein CcoS [Methylophilus methylotrophus]
MFANSYIVILLGLLVGLPTLLLLFMSIRAGHFDQLDQAAHMPFDEEDLRYLRPWESDAQRFERVRQHGAALAPRREWARWL